jgi:DNA-binding response OmpR family regulator
MTRSLMEMKKNERKTVLLVEDDPILGDIISRFMRKKCEVVIEQDGAKALATCESVKPAVIVLDIVLPNKNGKDILTDLRLRGDDLGQTPVVILTNLSLDTSDRDEFFRLGANRCYVKSQVEFNKLADEVAAYASVGKFAV